MTNTFHSNSTGNIFQSFAHSYAQNGNISTKDGMGMYNYDPDKKHALYEVVPYTEDAMVSPPAAEYQQITYNSFQSIEEITEGNYRQTFTYGFDDQRRKSTLYTRLDVNAPWVPDRIRYYIGDHEVQINAANQATSIDYIAAPGLGLIAVHVQSALSEDLYTVATDYLGNIRMVIDEAGEVIEEYNYGAWGEYRNPETWGKLDEVENKILFRGHTGHCLSRCLVIGKHMPDFGLINMNGRLYDPATCRMLCPDNYVQSPYNSQNYNRYSNVLNNPLKYTDPDGEIIIPILIGAGIGVLTNGINNSINGNAFFQGAGKAALIGGVSGAFSFGIGQAAMGMSGFGKVAFQTLAHGHLGGVMSGMNGGTYGQGFLSGAAGSLVASGSGALFKNSGKLVKGLGTVGGGALAGGVGAEIAGGNFWDGARNGAISAGLNHGIHQGYLGKDLMMASITGRFRHLYGPDARSYSLEAGAQAGVGIKPYEKGVYQVLRGKNVGWYEYDGMAFSAGTSSVGVEGTAIDLYYTGGTDAITASTFTGTYHQISVAVDVGIGISAVGLYSSLPNNQAVYGIGIGLSIDAVPNYVDFTYQYGATTLSRNHSDNPARRIFNP